MLYCIFVILGFPEFCSPFWPAPYKVDFNDQKTFVISASEDVDEESEIEMIQPEDLADMVPLINDEDRYKPLHSHVERYNRRAAEAKMRLSRSIPHLRSSFEETNSLEEGKPFVAGFKHELDEYNFDQSINNNSAHREKNVLAARSKRDEEADILGLTGAPKDDLLDTMSSRTSSEPQENNGHATPHPANEDSKMDSKLKSPEPHYEEGTSISIEVPTPSEAEEKTSPPEFGEEAYDYEVLRSEYDQQLNEAKASNMTFNYTDNGDPEKTPIDAIKKIVDFEKPKNCTKEELTQFGAKALECLAFDYQRSRNESDVRRVLSRTWTVVRIWLCIYVSIAVPCWLQKGWCCCCFRCRLCFPRDVIYSAKHYYAHNPPGILVDRSKGEKVEEPSPINYKPTLFELDAYESLESAIRNL